MCQQLASRTFLQQAVLPVVVRSASDRSGPPMAAKLLENVWTASCERHPQLTGCERRDLSRNPRTHNRELDKSPYACVDFGIRDSSETYPYPNIDTIDNKQLG